ncbi:hypothetical protein HOLleu_10683 [Holothuria leucospilota]|uniref:Endonuclease/exonuclease/phosphatase domain-containing protein n=1 Tax=Holothuria leucospilota TaxID=206669 RepID=A0A9Q1CFH7_HOLLE|nr:hypothetical protein HOLleu_10683 [Holothuria leucospilota]
MSGQRSQCHIHYVALSRVTSLNGLYILNLNEKKVNVDRNVLEEMKMLRTERAMQMCFQAIQTTESTTTVLHQNVRSLRKHINDIKSDATILSADVLVFTECHLTSTACTQDLHLDGYSLYLNKSAYSPACGTAMYTKNNITAKQESLNSNGIEITATTANTISGTVQIIAVYRPPAVSMQLLLQPLSSLVTTLSDTTKTLKMGDFNVNLLQDSTDKENLLQLMNSKNFKQIITGITTDYNSCLDHIYVNFSHTDIEAN